MFERAIELDPQYSDAWAGLSWTYQREILFEVVDDRKAWENKALETARRAVALDNGSSFAHLALGGAFIWSNQLVPSANGRAFAALPWTKRAIAMSRGG